MQYAYSIQVNRSSTVQRLVLYGDVRNDQLDSGTECDDIQLIWNFDLLVSVVLAVGKRPG